MSCAPFLHRYDDRVDNGLFGLSVLSVPTIIGIIAAIPVAVIAIFILMKLIIGHTIKGVSAVIRRGRPGSIDPTVRADEALDNS